MKPKSAGDLDTEDERESDTMDRYKSSPQDGSEPDSKDGNNVDLESEEKTGDNENIHEGKKKTFDAEEGTDEENAINCLMT